LLAATELAHFQADGTLAIARSMTPAAATTVQSRETTTASD
jgi:hypothetical protein